MIPNLGIRILAILLGIWLSGANPAHAEPLAPVQMTPLPRLLNLNTQQKEDIQQGLQSFAQANIVYLAETHDRAADHRAQLEIVRSLQAKRPLILGMEMFQRPFQWVLDQYLAGKITEAELLRQTEYPKRWGYDWELYAPIVRFAQTHRIPILALNAPSEATRKVARSGLEQLTLPERQWLPPLSTIRAEPETYRQRIRQIFDEMHQGQGNSASFDRFFLAQVLWDETMAHTIAMAHQRSPSALIIVLAGQGHVLYGEGIPDRVARRLNPPPARSLKQVTVILNPPPELPLKPDIADYFWYSPSVESGEALPGRR